MEKAFHDESKYRKAACRLMDRNNDNDMHNRRLRFDKNHKCSARSHKSILYASKNFQKALEDSFRDANLKEDSRLYFFRKNDEPSLARISALEC